MGKELLIYGVGNPYRGDDSVGLKVAEAVAGQVRDPRVDIKWGSIDGVAILDEIIGYKRVIFIDSVKTGQDAPGTVYKIKPSSWPHTDPFSSHGINFLTALQFGRKFGLDMPCQIDVFAVEIEDNTKFSEECTEKVRESIPKIVEAIIREIEAIQDNTGQYGAIQGN